MTYNEIISQVVRRLGIQGLSNELKADLRVAVSWAEQEMITEAKPNVATHIININSNRAEYQAPPDLEFTKEIIVYDSSDNPLLFEDVTYDQWLRWNPSATNEMENDVVGSSIALGAVIDDAMFNNKVLIAIANVNGVKTVHIKPAIDGKILLMYSPKRSDDIFDDLNAEPMIQEQYHQYIVPGAVYYLAQIKSGEAKAKGDMASVDFYARLEANSYGQFTNRKRKLIEKTDTKVSPAVAKAFTWFENPRKYR